MTVCQTCHQPRARHCVDRCPDGGGYWKPAATPGPTPAFTQDDVWALRAAADEVVQVNNICSPLSYQATHAKNLRELADRIERSIGEGRPQETLGDPEE